MSMKSFWSPRPRSALTYVNQRIEINRHMRQCHRIFVSTCPLIQNFPKFVGAMYEIVVFKCSHMRYCHVACCRATQSLCQSVQIFSYASRSNKAPVQQNLVSKCPHTCCCHRIFVPKCPSRPRIIATESFCPNVTAVRVSATESLCPNVTAVRISATECLMTISSTVCRRRQDNVRDVRHSR